jgi:diguanylate cyclase (GGDEF)-like protein
MSERNDSEKLKILVVTDDRVLQRQLAQFFDQIGYSLLQAADRQAARAAVDAQGPQVLLLDCDLAAAGEWELCRQLALRPNAPASFKFLLVDEPDDAQLHEALEAGIDDFLFKPLSYGELLARLRSAARVLEYDRRAGQQGRVDPLTGLLSLSAFNGHLRRQLTEHGGTAPRVACVVLDVDFFSRVPRTHGDAAAQSLAQSMAQQLNQLRAGSEVLGSLGADRFCVMLPGATEATAAEWAEKARDALAATAFKLGDNTLKITASFGVAACEAAERADQLLQRATQALQTAKSSGRNCVVTWSDRNAQAAQQLTPENLFARTVVWDVMTPATVYLQPEESVGEAISLVERTRLEAIPVVDAKGKLVGVCHEAELAEVPETDYAKRTVGDVLTSGVKTFDRHESLATLMAYFKDDTATLIVVVDGGRPVGIVTCDSLVAMSRPVEAGSLAAGAKYDDSSAYLLVSDPRPLEPEPVA